MIACANREVFLRVQQPASFAGPSTIFSAGRRKFGLIGEDQFDTL